MNILIIPIALLATVAIFSIAFLLADVSLKKLLEWMQEGFLFPIFMTFWFVLAFVGCAVITSILFTNYG